MELIRWLSPSLQAYEPGLLAKANRGILYVDEVNLLDDGLVDVVLDSAAGGQNTVEREGVSIVHPAKFIMIGERQSQAKQPQGSAFFCSRDTNLRHTACVERHQPSDRLRLHVAAFHPRMHLHCPSMHCFSPKHTTVPRTSPPLKFAYHSHPLTLSHLITPLSPLPPSILHRLWQPC